MMKKSKQRFIFTVLSIISIAMFGCSGKSTEKNGKTDTALDPELRQKIDSIAKDDPLLSGELENKTIKWMASWDINKPDDIPVDLAIFQEYYGGKIEFHQVVYEERYDKLTQAIQSGEGIDFFSAGDMDAFPKGAVSNMFIPADDYIDFDSPLWADVKNANDSLMWNGNHYVAAVSVTGDNCVVIYNKNTFEENGLEDPADLYYKGEWDWNAFENALISFTDTANQQYGIDGWWFEFGLINTTGVPAVSLSNQKLSNNLADPAMARVQNWIYGLYNKDLIAIGVGTYGWDTRPNYIGEGKLLFYPSGLYNFYCPKEQWASIYGEDVFFVPMPKDPEADAHYIPTGMDSYLIVNGAQNPEGVAKYLNCKRYAITNSEFKALADKQMYANYGWTDEMIAMNNELTKLASANPRFDVSRGVSSDCGKMLDDCLRYTARGLAPWNETFDSINSTIDLYLEEVNSASNAD